MQDGRHAGAGFTLIEVSVMLAMLSFDLPHVAEAARARIAEAGLRSLEAVGGDAFVAVPPCADAYVLKGVIHDWEDAEALAILRTAVPRCAQTCVCW